MRHVVCRFLAIILCFVAVAAVSCSFGGKRPTGGTPSALAPSNSWFDLEGWEIKDLWTQELGQLTGNKELRNIYVSGNVVVIEAGEGELHCLDAESGIWKATTRLPAELDRAPTALGETLFVMSQNSLFAYHMASDKLSDPVHAGFPVSTPPLLYQNTIILAGLNGRIVSFDLADGKRTRLTTLTGPIMEQPVISGGKLYAAAHNDLVAQWDLVRRREEGLWGPPGSAEISSGVMADGGYVYVGDNTGMLYALQADEYLERKTQHLAPAPITGTPQVRDQKLYALTEYPSLLCLATGSDMKLLWEHEGTVQLLAWGKNRVYVRQQDGSIAALSTEDGSVIWQDPLPASCKVAGDPARPAFYIADSAGSVMAFKELD